MRLIEIEISIQVAPWVYGLEKPLGSYMNTLSDLNETHRGPAPNQGKGKGQVPCEF